MDLSDSSFLDVLKHSHHDRAPVGYAAWLDRNITHHDPIYRAWRLRDSISVDFRHQQTFKCFDDRCVHYIYGYSQSAERDRHARDHVLPTARDSALSIDGTPLSLFSEQPSATSWNRNIDNPKQGSSSYHAPRPSIQLPPLLTESQNQRASDPSDDLKAYSLGSQHPNGRKRSVDESEDDPLLPPLKRSRAGRPRLESIGELRLFRDIDPCLRCKVLGKNVSEGCRWHEILI